MTYFRRAAVVGGGTMGRGIAQVMSGHGVDVTLVEKDAAMAGEAMEAIGRQLDGEMAKWGITAAEKEAVLARIEATDRLPAIEGADVVVEAIHEDMAAKQRLWAAIEPIVGPAALEVTHTATLSVSEIASRLADPTRMIGMHFLPPAPRVPVVEIVRGLRTSEETLARARELALALGKTPVEVNEYPGYITARIIVPMLNEAMYALMEGVASARDIDTAVRLGFNLEVGPLALADRIGLDQVIKWMSTLFAELGDLKYRPCPLLRKMVRAGHLGVKTGKGFFEYGSPVV